MKKIAVYFTCNLLLLLFLSGCFAVLFKGVGLVCDWVLTLDNRIQFMLPFCVILIVVAIFLTVICCREDTK